MKNGNILFFLVIFTTVALTLSCSGSSLEKLAAEHDKTRQQVQQIQAERDACLERLRSVSAAHDKLSEEAAGLRRLVDKLKLEKQLLGFRCDELKEWSRTLADGYGEGIWYMDETTLPVFVEPMPSAGIPAIAASLNRRFAADGLPEIRILAVDGGNARVRVDDVEQLTQRMGSHGARSYINAVLYSIASTRGVECVVFEFQEGIHAVPGEYCR